jgi:transposase
MHKEEQRFVIKYLWTKGWRSKKIHEELITTLGDDAYHLSQIKTWLQRFKNGDLSCKDCSRPGRPVFTLGSQLEALLFYQKVANSISYISSITFFRI